jgi:hypothetical protein
MEILVRKKGEKEWRKVSEQRFQNEAELQNILYESPEIIPIEKLGGNLPEPKLFIKEAGLPGSGNTDLIGIDEKGGITIIECKLATNADIRRKVIGQVLEYAAYLWQMTYDQFDDICSKAEQWGEKHLADRMREKMEGTEETWAEDDFRDSVVSTLSKGDFRLIIAVDALNDELKRIIQFLNSRGEGFSQIYALEMRHFSNERLQMLVPELFGPPPPPPPTGRRYWTEAEFLKDVEDKKCEKDVAETIKKLLDFAKRNGKIKWGTGAARGSFTFNEPKMGLSIFTVYSNGDMSLNPGWMIAWQKVKQREKILESFRAELNQIPGINTFPEGAFYQLSGDAYRAQRVHFLTQGDNLERFENAVLSLCQAIEFEER